MDSQTNIDSFFIELHPDTSLIASDDRVLAFEGEDSFEPGCLQKTILAINKYIINGECEYDYVVRTNLSSVIHLPRLYEHLERVTDPIYYAGYMGYHRGISFCSGALFIMSKEIATYVGKNAYMYSMVPDDVYIGDLITQKYGYIHRSLNRQECGKGDINVEDPMCFHYRFKSSNREEDVELHRECVEMIYLNTFPEIRRRYTKAYKVNSDINEHIPTLYEYALLCDSIVECRSRSINTSWGFLMGLVGDIEDGPRRDKLLTCCDRKRGNIINEVEKLSRDAGVLFHFVEGNDTEIPLPEADLYFIDTWHVYAHMKVELNLFRNKAKKFIIMHDTVVDGVLGESIRIGWDTKRQSEESGYAEEDIRRGIQPAIQEFLDDNPEWVLDKFFPNNNGLTVLKKVDL